MMNKDNILNIAKTIFTNISPTVNENIYRGDLFIDSNKPAGIYYFDFSDSINKIDFKEYQEGLLAKEYFSNPGNLQWNYYLILFQDHFDHKKKWEIERNDKYARKFVFSEKEFQDFFSLESSNKLESTNIVLEWKKSLDSVDLQEVYSSAPVSSAIQRFLHNKTEKQEEKKQKIANKTSSTKIENIKKLTLTDKYRPFPIQRDFDFKKVNLIKGINGVGKTSLLEAIELILCGTTKRNPENKESEGAIKAIFNDSKTENYIPNQNEFYRKRDLLWYSNNYPKKNFLCQSFNRYNFFNSDAAFNFSNSDKDFEIKEALFNIVLGSEYNYISDRAEKFFGYVKAEFNGLKKEMKSFNNAISDANKIIKSSKPSNNLSLIKEKIAENLNYLKPKKVIKDVEKNYVVIEELNNRIKSIIEKIKEDSTNLKSLKEISDRLSLFIPQKKNIELDMKRYEELLNEEVDTHSDVEKFSKKLSLLDQCNKYFSEKKLFEIDGISVKYESVIQGINKIKQVEEMLNEIDRDSYMVSLSLNEYFNKKNNELSRLQEKKILIDKMLKESLDNLNKTERIIKEIKLLGQEFLEINNNATECPLCQSHFNEDELRIRIEILSQTENVIEAEQIQSLHNDLKESNNLIEMISREISDVKRIEAAYLLLLSNEDSKDKTLLDIMISIQENKKDIIKLNELKNELENLKTLANSFNVSESELIFLKDNIKQDFENLELIYSNKDLFTKNQVELEKQFDQKKSAIEKLADEKVKLALKLKQNSGIEINNNVDLKKITNNLLKEEKRINLVKDLFGKISELIKLNENDSIDDLDLMSSVLSKNIKSLISELKNQFEIEAASIRKKEAEQSIRINQEKFIRLEKAKSILESLVSNDGNKQLEEFFKQNLVEITDIFQTIHVPKEFASIIFVNKELYLIDIHNKKRKISEISSGQRSALTLSIFISLNRKLKNGPNIIMFDDPVSFIDDFNALSFLDFLRYFILKEKRQIFFATAITKLASLFERKFEFLEEDFKLITLTRNE